MNNFNLNLFKYFYYVVYYNGFSNASRSLSVAQSSLSYNVKQLESQLDKKLIIRDSKTFELTEDGYNLYEVLKPAFGIINKSLEKLNNKNIAEITIGIRHYLSDFILKESLEEMIALYPDIHINIKLYSKMDINKFDEDYDILIDYDDYTNLIKSDNKIKLCELDNAFVSGFALSNKYLLINSIKELNGEKLISLCPNRKNGKFQKLCYDNKILFENIISINDSEISKQLIKNNAGIGFVNKDFVRKEIINGEIKEINVNEDIFKDNIEIVYKRNSKSDEINKFITVLLKQYGRKLNE